MSRRVFKSKSQAKSHARNHGFRQSPSGAKSGPVVVRKLTPAEMEQLKR